MKEGVASTGNQPQLLRSPVLGSQTLARVRGRQGLGICLFHVPVLLHTGALCKLSDLPAPLKEQMQRGEQTSFWFPSLVCYPKPQAQITPSTDRLQGSLGQGGRQGNPDLRQLSTGES